MARRMFLAIECDAIRRSAAKLIDRLAAASDAEVKWVESENLHVTLKFFGELDDRDSYEIAKAVMPLARQQAAFDVQVRGVGAFPAIDRPRTLWLGMRSGAEELTDLADRLQQALVPLGHARERRRFHPHLTIGRVRAGRCGADLSAELERLANRPVGSMTVNELVLFSSQLRREGPQYTVLARHRFEG